MAAEEKEEADDAELEVGTPSWARQLGMGMSGAKKGVEKLLWQGNHGKEVDGGAVTEAAFSLPKVPPRVKKGTHVFDYAKAQISFEERTN